MITPAERITFIVTRGVVALALVGAGMFCISKGIGFWAVPREEASQLGLDVLGLHLNAGGLGGVIFGAGIAICFFAYKTAPKGLAGRERSGTENGWNFRQESTEVAYEAKPDRDLFKRYKPPTV